MSCDPIEMIVSSDDGDIFGLRFREIAGRVFLDEFFLKKVSYRITAIAISPNLLAVAGDNKVSLFSKVKWSFEPFGTFEDEMTQTVTAIEFVPQTKLLIVGFASGVLKLIENNMVEHIWDKDKGHQGHKISSISAHSSGKIALTFSASSGILKTWNLEKRKLSYIVDISSPMFNMLATGFTFNGTSEVKFSPDGQVFAVSCIEYILVIESLTGKTVALHQMQRSCNNFAWLDSLRLLVADNSGNVEIFSSLIEDAKIQLIEEPAMTPSTTVYCWDKKIVVARSYGEFEIFTQKNDYIEEYCKYTLESGHIGNMAILGSVNGRSYFYSPGEVSPDCEVLVQL